MTEDIHIYNGSNYEEIVKTTLFVDKTLLLKRFFQNTKHGLGLLVRTPRHFGKSTNMDMIKRFCEINVNNGGQKVDSERTKNYNIFRNNYLNIYRLTDFFDRHFGKYPVISIDYQPLSTVKTVEEMLGVFFRIIMMDTFLQHKYLLSDTHLWRLNDTHGWVDKQRFTHYIDPELNVKLTESDVETGFSFLARLLHKKFETHVIVLIDNFDAFVDSPLYADNSNIFHFLSAINCDLLRCESVERSLVTGVIRPSGPSVDVLPSCVVTSRVEHEVWPFYGLNGKELDELLQPIIPDDEQREKVMGKIVHDYSGYSVATFEAGEDGSGQILDAQTCSVWSVIKYMEKELAVENFSSLV